MADYVERQIILTTEHAVPLNQILDLHRRRLWHQLTSKLEEFVHPDTCANIDLVEFYTHFIKTFSQRLNQLSLVRICIHIAHQIEDPTKKIEFLTGILEQQKVKDTPEAIITGKATIGEWSLLNKDLAKSKENLDAAKSLLDKTAGVEAPVHSSFHHAWALYYLAKQEPENFFASALQYLGYTQPENIPEQERGALAFNMGVAALLGEKIFNFGELINHPILQTLQENQSHQWLVEVLQAFYAGKIRDWVSLKSKYQEQLNNPEYGLVSKAYVLEDKIAILSFLELVFTKTGQDRKIPFAIIAESSLTEIGKVELLVMRALSLGLIKGTIDEIDQVVYISWVQPRLLSIQQISTMSVKLADWNEKVKNSLNLLENQMTPELIS